MDRWQALPLWDGPVQDAVPSAAPVSADAAPIAPAAPEATAGTPGPDTLDGTWNLVASQCGDPASEGRLTIQGNKFTFPTSDCTVGTSEVQTNYTSVSLGCSGAANRQARQARATPASRARQAPSPTR